MSWEKYTVEEHAYTKDAEVLFADLTDKGGVTIPSTFDSTPYVSVVTASGIVKGKAINISATGFRLERCRGLLSSRSKTGTFNIRIFGES